MLVAIRIGAIPLTVRPAAVTVAANVLRKKLDRVGRVIAVGPPAWEERRAMKASRFFWTPRASARATLRLRGADVITEAPFDWPSYPVRAGF
jgi:hypothetical protein